MDPKFVNNVFKVAKSTYMLHHGGNGDEVTLEKINYDNVDKTTTTTTEEPTNQDEKAVTPTAENEKEINDMIDNFINNNFKFLNKVLNYGYFEEDEHIEDKIIITSLEYFQSELREKLEYDFFKDKLKEFKENLFYTVCEKDYHVKKCFEYIFLRKNANVKVEVDYKKGYELAFKNKSLDAINYLLENYRSEI